MPGAIAIVVVGFAESVAAARTYSRKHGYKVDANQELIALGAANAASGLVGSFVVDGSLSKSAAADQAGQKTQLASIGLTAAVFITILFLTGLFENLPEATLGAIVIHAVWHLIDFSKVSRYWKIRGDDFWAGLAALLGVLAFDILAGLVIAVSVSFLLILARASRPGWAILGAYVGRRLGRHRIPEPRVASRREDGSGTADLPLRRGTCSSPTPTSSLTTCAKPIAAADPEPQVVLFDAESVSDIDSTAVGVLRDLIAELREVGIEVWAARIKTRVSEMLGRLGVLANAPIYSQRDAGRGSLRAGRSTRPGRH